MIQKNYKYGIDILEVERDRTLDEEDKICDLRCGSLPIRKDDADEYDIAIYIEMMKERKERWRIYQDNKTKACGLIMSFCSREMVNRIEETAEHTRIKDNPFKLLDEIKKKMYEAGRSKYCYVGLTDQIDRILNTKQEDGRTSWNIQSDSSKYETMQRDHWGETFLESFIMNTPEYKMMSDANMTKSCDALVKESTGAWMALSIHEERGP